MNVRAKFRCMEIVNRIGHKSYKFSAVCADEVPENQRYHQYTPSGTLEITVTNPKVDFQLGGFYYLDFVDANPVSASDAP